MKNGLFDTGDDILAASVEGLVNCFERIDLTPEDIVDHIKDMNKSTIAMIEIIAFSRGDNELAKKIKKANDVIRQRAVNEFKQAVANGTYEEYLSNISWTDKTSLEVDMGLTRLKYPGEKELTDEEQLYYNIINNSIDKDLENIALSQGFTSVDAWRRNNEIHSSHKVKTHTMIHRGFKDKHRLLSKK